MATKKKMLQAAAGNAGGGAGGGAGGALNVEDVFSTYLYDGNGSSQVIENGVALGDLKEADDGVYYLSSPSSVIGNNSAGNTVTATLDGNVTLSSGITKFASNSYDFDGASNIRLSSALIDTSSSFCFETWVYFGSTGNSTDMAMLLAQYKSGEDGRLLFGAQGTNLVVRYNGANMALTASVSSSTWYHVAWSYDGTTHRLFVNGNLEDSTTLDFPIYTGVTTQLGGTDPTLLSGYDLSGNMEDIRITTGDARYTSSFSPPTASLPVTTAATVLVSGEGGLVWLKSRNDTYVHKLMDTNRGPNSQLESNSTSGAGSQTTLLTAFNSDGFSLGSNAQTNASGVDYASWTFRKAPKFFTCVQYTGTGSAQNISHDLGSDVGFLLIKKTNGIGNWRCWHRGLPGTGSNMEFNQTGPYETSTTIFNGTDPTSTQFSVGTNSNVNGNGGTYVAYLFAHNDGDGEFGPDGDADIIKCGSWDSVENQRVEIDLGFEPQFVIVKGSSYASDWRMFDNMRGLHADGDDAELQPHNSNAETTNTDRINITSTGFSSTLADGSSGNSHIYIAIRRGTKVPESGTEVFEPTAYTGNNTANRTVGGLTIDMNIIMDRTKTVENDNLLFDRMRGQDVVLKTNATSGDGNGWGGTYYNLDQQHGFSNGSDTSYLNNSSGNYISYIWKRAPGYFDVVAEPIASAQMSGPASSSYNPAHNLGVTPEMIWVRDRNTTDNWCVYHSALGTSKKLILNSVAAESSSSWAVASDNFNFYSFGNATGNAICYLFASLDGISKVGSYTGNGGTQTIDCGFTSGARFILIKRTDGSGNWYVWDTARGIVAGNDARLELNTTDAENDNVDEIDPHSSGFIVNNVGGGQSAQINGNNDEYIFYAIA